MTVNIYATTVCIKSIGSRHNPAITIVIATVVTVMVVVTHSLQ
jgi:hypothetical protein